MFRHAAVLVQLEYDADVAFAVRRRCLLFSLCVSSPFSLAILCWVITQLGVDIRLSFVVYRCRLSFVVYRKAARKIVTVDEDREFASPEISMSVRISEDAEDLASRVVLFVVDRSRSR